MAKRKTNEEFLCEVFDLVGDEYVFLETYRGSEIKIEVRHNVCKHTYSVRPANFLKGRRCPKCKTPNRDRDTAKFKDFVKEKANDEYEVLGEYINTQNNIKMKHKVCGYTWEPLAGNFISGKRCPKCAGNIKFTFEEVKKYVEENSDCELISREYINSELNLFFKCNCGELFERSLGDFKLSEKRCPKCSRLESAKKRRIDIDELRKKVKFLVGDEYLVLGEQTNNEGKILMKHKICGFEYSVQPSNFLRGNRCPSCRIIVVTAEDFRKEVYRFVGEEYTLLSDYTNAVTKVTIRHEVCGHEYGVLRNKFLSGRRCPNCKPNRHITYSETLDIANKHNLKPLFTENEFTKGGDKFVFEMTEGYKIFISVNELKGSKQLQPFSVFNPHTMENIHLYCAINGDDHICLSNKYIGWNDKLFFKCPNSNHEPYDMTFNDFQTGYRCRYCAYEKISKRMTGSNNPMAGVVGKNHPNYNPELTDQEREHIRETPEYKTFKNKVRKRDDYICKCCNKKRFLFVHHLNGYHWFKEGRLDLDNAVGLCKDCHDEFHLIYGRKYNTKEQFLEFLNHKNEG